MGPYGSVGNGQAKPRAVRLAGEEGLKDMGKLFLRDAAAGVADRDEDAGFSRRGRSVPGARPGGQEGGVQADGAGAVHRLPGVAQKVEEDFPQPDPVAPDDGEGRVQAGRERYRAVRAGSGEGEDELLHESAEGERGQAQGAAVVQAG